MHMKRCSLNEQLLLSSNWEGTATHRDNKHSVFAWCERTWWRLIACRALKDQFIQPCWGIQSAMFGNQKSSAHCAGQFSFHRVQNMSMGIRKAKLPTLFLYWVIPLGTHTVGPLPGAIKESLHIPAHHMDTEDFVIVLVSIFPSLGNVHLHALWHSGIW